MREVDDITGTVIDIARQMHRDLGPGQLESVYEAILARLLERRGLRADRQKFIPVEYQGMVFEEGFVRTWSWRAESLWRSGAWSISRVNTPHSS